MEPTNNKKPPTRKRSAKKEQTFETKAVPVSPFDEVVEPVETKKTTTIRVKATAATPVKPVKPQVKKADTPIVPVDAFAETADASLPVKHTAKPTKKTGTAASVKTKPAKEAEPKAKTKNPVAKRTRKTTAVTVETVAEPTLDITPEIAADEPKVELSPVFKALADVTLPDLKRENRAQLLMQSPTRLYFYWSVRQDPYKAVNNVFEGNTNYTLVLKLKNLTHGTEDISPVEAVGNWWFSVEPNCEYQAEIGFYATARPYFRIIYSNTVATPRRTPSPRQASDAKWSVSANEFAEVLDVSGFKRDAYDVALAGDHQEGSDDSTQLAFRHFIGADDVSLNGIAADELRFALIAIAGGATLESLRYRVSAAVFSILGSNASAIDPKRAASSLGEYFETDGEEFFEEEFGSAVYGASLVNFPKTLKTRTLTPKYSPRYNPVSSFSIG
jgi:hypothetical protein